MTQRLAKVGFTQAYTYFTWRNTKEELQEYLEELIEYPLNEYFGPNFWPNTPDILPASLKTGGRAAFLARLVLAATMTSNYGIYGRHLSCWRMFRLSRGVRSISTQRSMS